jgi:hypothetical protein
LLSKRVEAVLFAMVAVGPLVFTQAYAAIEPSASLPDPMTDVLLVGRLMVLSLPAFATGTVLITTGLTTI